MIPKPLVMLLLVGALAAAGEAAARWNYQIGLESAWREVKEREDGATLVREQGVLAAVAGGAALDAGDWRLGLHGGMIGGSLDYDGATQLGAPLSTKAEWRGWHAGAGIGRRLPGLARLQLGGRATYESRTRDILPIETVQGLGEQYRTLWLDVRGTLQTAGWATLEAGFGCAVASAVEVRFEERFDDADLSLDDHCRADAAANLKLGRIGSKTLYVRPFASWERYARSPAVRLTADGTGVGSIHLPETELVSFGVTISVRGALD